MAEGGAGDDNISWSDEEAADVSDSDTDDTSDESDNTDEDEVQLEDDGEKIDDEDELAFLNELDHAEPTEDGGKSRLDIKCMSYVSENFYRKKVTPQHINILTDFVDAEIFLIDGDSLLLELLGEKSLDWSHGGQFLHLTYLLERFFTILH
ncbi:hypothetical protein OS493_003891 [Desmophyllum pertusum]|uniref:ATP-dependent RNA helicase DDX60 PIN-like domain-containing protein n=1 Tax=Desmophyllum pertusum TaxID=174260 RepID=A0A9W9ZTT5_9CNID|nr:hypothetical protein OS493_003891 [Desmophyllum pertusum]